MMKRLFTKNQTEFIKENYFGISSQELADKLNQQFNTNFTAVQLNAYKGHHGLKCDFNATQFKTCNVPWNDGTKGQGLTGANKGSFKPKPIGSMNRHQNCTLIKTANGWETYARYMYEKYHDCKLTDNERINFLDRDTTNFSKENLIKVTMQEVARLHRNGYVFDDPELNKASIGVVRLKIKVKEMEKKNENY